MMHKTGLVLGAFITVENNAQYAIDFAEPTPFKAVIDGLFEGGIGVTSLVTGKGYELCSNQLTEYK